MPLTIKIGKNDYPNMQERNNNIELGIFAFESDIFVN